MNSYTHKTDYGSDFRTKTTLGVSFTVLLLVTPLCINHFVQGRYLLGIGSLIIVAMFAANAWSCSHDRYNHMITFLGLAPAITLFLVYVIGEMGTIGAFWCYPTMLAFYFMLPERKAWIANTVFLLLILPQAWFVLEPPLALRFTLTLVAVGSFSAIFVRVITKQQHVLKTQIATDPLTGLLNRTLLHETLENAIQQNHRTDIPMTLITLDLDYFKTINDTLGHDAGDKVLRSIGELLRGRIRRSDKVFRLGGEEFLVLLYDTDVENGLRFAEELRSTIESQSILPDYTVTASIGITTLQSDENWDEWMKRCDKKLYRAKLNGRNRVVD